MRVSGGGGLSRRAKLEDNGGSWHKPATWQDLERLLEGYDGCTDYDVCDVPKMVVDTTAADGFEKLCSGVLEFIASYGGGPMSYHSMSNEI
ncbi:P-loop containing nucleoside triphosphate hydrolase [Quillaja saponaria]|uniref:P-loop containing nucleoside triphosphate hydrolase n=1 Tax=Quillaja saponaria TaxID=32244 RepID=A0AAD7PRP3_QUISA|nr:P-loop containing nucleoside triphosphate hydrolase [Quillaja saponaria]